MQTVAVVVSYNRASLLAECLDALAAQTVPLAAIVVVDNHSTDDAVAIAREHPAHVDLVELTRNTGGAGGFAVGIARALDAHVPDWVWVMDDDTIPEPEAHRGMLDAVGPLGTDYVVGASRVLWTDGREHPMNTARVKPFARSGERATARSAGALPIRTTSFVSCFLRADRVREAGLPIASYFIWNDDFEYTARLIRGHRAVQVPDSVVVHKTKAFGSTDADPGERFYFEVRNKLWMLRFSRAFGWFEGLLYAGSSVRRWIVTIGRSRRREVLRDAFRRGWRDGWRTRPLPNSELLAGAVSDPALSGAVLRLDGGRVSTRSAAQR